VKHWLQTLRKNTGLNPYVWIIFFILPFYFIVQSPTTAETVFGIIMILAFFVCYVLSFIFKGWPVYFWTSMQIAISILMSVLYAYIYFSLFLAFFIGHLKNKVAFYILYSIHIVATFATINYGLVTQNTVFLTQLPFVFLSLVAVILLPVNTFNKNKEDRLQGQLEDANKRISELVKQEERQRIARDLHDTLGQKLSLIGLKSDLAAKLIDNNPEQARVEIKDVQHTARVALQEVRELVTEMRGTRLEDEVHRVIQILKVAQIEFELSGDPVTIDTTLIAENVVSMCVKEAITNVVKHSGATCCKLSIESAETELVIRIQDNGNGLTIPTRGIRGNGLRGMRERLEFVNGTLEISSNPGTTLVIRVPKVVIPRDKDGIQ
jgi:two-component system, NarL family, sensor histidine kinase DesK